MLAIEITFTLFPLLGMLLVAFAVGFMFRSAQIKSYRRKVLDLEKEMLSNHAEILELQKERASLLRQMKESRIPVISMSQAKEEADKRQAK
jgi:hypothetical protein